MPSIDKALPTARAVSDLVDLLARTDGPANRALADALSVLAAARRFVHWIDMPHSSGERGDLLLASLRNAVSRSETR